MARRNVILSVSLYANLVMRLFEERGREGEKRGRIGRKKGSRKRGKTEQMKLSMFWSAAHTAVFQTQRVSATFSFPCNFHSMPYVTT